MGTKKPQKNNFLFLCLTDAQIDEWISLCVGSLTLKKPKTSDPVCQKISSAPVSKATFFG